MNERGWLKERRLVVGCVVLVAALAWLSGCNAPPGEAGMDGAGETLRVSRGLAESERRVQRSGVDAREGVRSGNSRTINIAGDAPALILADRTIQWSAVKPRLVEAAGGVVLEEMVLDALLERRAADRGISATPESLQREREILLSSYVDSGVADDRAQAERLVAQIRGTRGLGTHRFDDLIRRNALLRGLVAERVLIDEAVLQRAYELRHGPRYQVRLITTPSASQATRAADRFRAGEDFSRIAAEVSTDPSAARGGLVDPISPADITYPESLRRVLTGLRAGELSPAIAIESGYAVVLVDGVVGPRGGDWSAEQRRQPPIERVREQLVDMERRRQERLLMDQVVRELLAGAAVRFEDPDLARAWRNRGESG